MNTTQVAQFDSIIITETAEGFTVTDGVDAEAHVATLAEAKVVVGAYAEHFIEALDEAIEASDEDGLPTAQPSVAKMTEMRAELAAGIAWALAGMGVSK